MTAYFADAFFYLALLNPRDEYHTRVTEFAAGFDDPTVTTTWVLTELADALSAREHRQSVAEFLGALLTDPAVEIIPPSSGLFERGLRLFRERPDKGWSLTDCISFVVMEERGIRDALTGDHHFEQAGFAALLK